MTCDSSWNPERLQTQVKPHGMWAASRFTPRCGLCVPRYRVSRRVRTEAGNATTKHWRGCCGLRIGRSRLHSGRFRHACATQLGAARRFGSCATGSRCVSRHQQCEPAAVEMAGRAGARRYRLQLAPMPNPSFSWMPSSMLRKSICAAPADGNYWATVRRSTTGAGGTTPCGPRAAPASCSTGHSSNRYPDRMSSATAALFVERRPGLPVHYRVQIARDSQFTRCFWSARSVQNAHFDVAHVPPGKYFWRVAAVDGRGESGDWSRARIHAAPKLSTPYPPAVYRPRNATSLGSAGWHALSRADSAHPQFTAALLDQTLDQPSLSMRDCISAPIFAVQTVAEGRSKAPFRGRREV